MALAPYSRRKQKTSHQYLAVFAVIVLVAAAALLVRFLYSEVIQHPEATKDYLFEPNAVSLEKTEARGDEVIMIEEGSIAYQINTRMIYQSDRETLDLMAANPEENTYYIRVRLIGDGEEILLESGMLKPGSQLKNASLNRVPEKGVYPVTVEFEAFDIATLESVGTARCAAEIQVI